MAEHGAAVEVGALRQPRIVVGPWVVLIVLSLGMFMILLDVTIVNVAIPSIERSLHASLDQVFWVIDGYILTFAVLLITAGRLGDMFGSKKLYLGGLALFTLASLACALAQNPTQLIAFRVVQGIGGAALTPQTLAIISSIFPPQQRGAAFGAWGAIAGFATVAGPLVGGLLTTKESWSAIFYLNVPIGIVAMVLAVLMMPELVVDRPRMPDIVGVVLLAAGLFAGIFALIEGQRYDWGRISDVGALNVGSLHAGLLSIPSLFVYSVLLLILFVAWELGRDEPILPLSLFKDTTFVLGNIVALAISVGLLGLFVPYVLLLQNVLHMSPLEAGVAIIPCSIASMVCAGVAGGLEEKVNGKYFIAVGLLFFTAGLLIFRQLAATNTSGATYIVPLACCGVGMGLVFAVMVNVSLRNVAPSSAGVASGFIETMQEVGSALGTAIVGAVLAHGIATEQAKGVAFGPAFVHALQTALPIPAAVTIAGVIAAVFMRVRKEEGAALETAFEAPVAVAPQVEHLVPATQPVAAQVRADDTAAIPARTLAAVATKPCLVDMSADRVYPVDAKMTIGRLRDNDLVVPDPKASRRHAEIVLENGQAMIRDLGSLNGTRVNGALIQKMRPLFQGDVVMIGDRSYSFRARAQPAR